jgi:hypothetical protein
MAKETKATFQQLPVGIVSDRVTEGGSSIDEIWKIFHGRAELEEKNIIFSLKASHMNVHQHEIPHSTSAHACGLLKNYYVYTSRDQAAFHESLNIQVVNYLEEVKGNLTASTEPQKALIRDSTKHLSSSYDLLEKAKNNQKKAEADLKSATEKLMSLENAAVELERSAAERKKEGQIGHREGLLYCVL